MICLLVMKIAKLKRVPNNRIGRYSKNGIKLELHEENTAKLLCQYGFSVEAIKPVNTPKVRNPDYLIGGSIWETKSPTTSNLKTIKKRMHETSEQATRIIVDLRRVKKNYNKIEKDVIKRFCNKDSFKVMVLITESGEVFEYRK